MSANFVKLGSVLLLSVLLVGIVASSPEALGQIKGIATVNGLGGKEKITGKTKGPLPIRKEATGLVTAVAEVFGFPPKDVDSKDGVKFDPGPPPKGASVKTRRVMAMGGGSTADAAARISATPEVDMNGKLVSVTAQFDTPDGMKAVRATMPNVRAPISSAGAGWEDPFSFAPVSTPMTLTYEFQLPAGFGLQAAAEPPSVAFASTTYRARSTLAGFEDLFTMSVRYASGEMAPTVFFESLGTQNTTTEHLIESMLMNTPPGSGNFVLSSNLEVLSLDLPVPADTSFDISFDATAVATFVPEPAAIVIAGVGGACLLCYVRSRRMRKAQV
jgi:hypothetical protein